MAAKRRKSKVKKYTLAEFKAWLEGVEEIQPDDWSPNKQQWDMIREKIGAIVEEEKTATVERPDVPTPAGPIARDTEPTRPIVAGRPESPMPANPPPPPPTSAFESSLPMKPAVGGMEPEMTPAARAALQGKLPTEIATDPSVPAKTSNIDTSKGEYKSSFG